MARIRSIHPSFFTDEACVSCSALARLLYIGLWTDADDQGLFEWKPLQIKMRLLPGDNVDAGSLLEELIAAGLVAKFTTGEKHLGAIKDFRSYQRPKKPNSVHVLPPEWRTYVGLQDVSSEPSPRLSSASAVRVPNQFPTGGGNPPQMEDGGEDVGEEDIGTSSLLSDRGPTEIAANDHSKPSTALTLIGEPSPPARRGKPKAEPTAAERENFDAFWSVYPRREGKQPALTAYVAAIRSGVQPNQIWLGAQLYAAVRQGQDPKLTKMAQGWLNDRRWEDEIAEPPPSGYRDHRGTRDTWDPMQQAIDGMDFDRDDAA